MLKNLHIENIAVIERADVEFSAGLNVLTGETGAGKSIMIDAINAVLGRRTSRELVRTGAPNASVTASFESVDAAAWCEENGVEMEDGELILQRRLSPDGKSSARVNGVPVSVTQLRELGALLLDIHGQNDGRQLLDEKNHLGYLDRYGVAAETVKAYSDAYNAYRALVREAEKLQMDERDKLQLEESLRFRVQELEKAQLRAGEEDELRDRRDLLRNSEKLTEFLHTAYSTLYEMENSAVSLCGDGEYALERAGAWSPDLLEAAELVRTARMSLEDAAERVREKQADLDFSPEEYDRLEERLSLLHRLQKKYFTDEEGLISLLEESRQRLDDLEYAGDRLIKLEKETALALTAAKKAAMKLSEERASAAVRLEKQVTGELRDLSMPSVCFRVKMEPLSGESGLDASGMDTVCFAMSANAGEALGPISRIASGGELSRIMLALKNVFAEKDSVDALIFDEIDTGVSGIAAQRVAEKLARLAKSKQVLCVTHLPQIAAMAEEQYLVSKAERNGRTFTDITALDRDGRCREIARINGGERMTDALLASASEMLDQAESYRRSIG